MHLARVTDDRLCFGCLKAVDMSGRPLVVLVIEDLRRAHLHTVPRQNAVLLCRPYHDSVCIPVAEVNEGHMLVRRGIPDDLGHAYFPAFLQRSTTARVLLPTKRERAARGAQEGIPPEPIVF